MPSCPHCSHNLLRQIRAQDTYWYCRRCRQEAYFAVVNFSKSIHKAEITPVA